MNTANNTIPEGRVSVRLRCSSQCFNVSLHSSIWMYSISCSRRCEQTSEHWYSNA